MNSKNMSEYAGCNLCPRGCQAFRNQDKKGFCGVGNDLKIARAALHFWEEPCISGTAGSGTIFFSGCTLRCVFCQNQEISGGKTGKIVSVDRLVDIFFELKDKGAKNINLVTPDHYIPHIRDAIVQSKQMDFDLPFVYNSSGYVTVESLRMLDGLIDVYLPDFKYMDGDVATQYSHAPDYPEVVKSAIAEMARQVGYSREQNQDCCAFDEEGMMIKGVIVRHLLLPGQLLGAKQIVRYLHETYGDAIYISLMNQYTPIQTERLQQFPELQNKTEKKNYKKLVSYAMDLGVTRGFIQEGETASESFIPPFNLEGV